MAQPAPLAFRPGPVEAEIDQRTTDERGHGRAAVVARDLARYYQGLRGILESVSLTAETARMLIDRIDHAGSGPLYHALVDAVERYRILRAREPDTDPDAHLIAVGLWRGAT